MTPGILGTFTRSLQPLWGCRLAQLGRRQSRLGWRRSRGVGRLPSDGVHASRWSSPRRFAGYIGHGHGDREELPRCPGLGHHKEGHAAAGDPVGNEISERAGREGLPPPTYRTQSQPKQPKNPFSGACQATGNTPRGVQSRASGGPGEGAGRIELPVKRWFGGLACLFVSFFFSPFLLGSGRQGRKVDLESPSSFIWSLGKKGKRILCVSPLNSQESMLHNVVELWQLILY